MKRALCILSVFCLLIAFLPAAVTAETYENMTYSVSDGKVTITDCTETVAGSLTVPATIAGYPVTAIATDAFADCTGLTGITIGQNVTSVGTGAFSGCTALASIAVAEGNPVYHSAGNCLIETSSKTLIAGCKNSVIPTDGTVTAIGNLAFHNCDSLTDIEIPAGVVSVGASAFEGCTQLADVTIGSSVATIGNSAFYGCSALTGVVIPDSVTSMGVYVFYGCTKLSSVVIGNQVKTIGNSAFAACTELTDVTIGSGVVTIDVFAFNGCSKLADISIPNGVTTIGKFAFYNCAALKSVQIPESVNNIGKNAFAGCGELKLLIKEENTYAIGYAEDNNIPYIAQGIGSLAVTTVSLKPGVTGVYFGSSLDWAANNSEILAYGIAVSTENSVPVADGSDESSLYTQGSVSVLITNVLKTENDLKVNKANARSKIYARVYVKLSTGEYLYSEVVQATLQQVVMAAQNDWQDLSEAQKGALKQMYNTYADVMSSWNIPNLKNA